MSQSLERIYEPDECVSFRKTSEAFGGLSNMAPGFRVRVNGILFLTVEALYQACRFPHIPDLQRFIIEQKSPMTLKMRIRHLRENSRSDWDKVRVKIMKWCIRVKLAQNLRSFGSLLLETGNRPIVEDSRRDPFWGAMMSSSGALVGINVLGRLLMELRDEVRLHGLDTPLEVSPPDLPDFLLLGEQICAVSSKQTQYPLGSQGRISWLPHHDARVKLSTVPVTQEAAKRFVELMDWISESGLDFHLNAELVTHGGCDPEALRKLEGLLNDLKLGHLVKTIAKGTVHIDPHLRLERPSNSNIVNSGSSKEVLVKSTNSSSKERS